jgi:arylformamidase
VQYNNRLRVAASAEHSARFTQESAALRLTARCTLDVAYGPAPREKLDLFFADRPNAPAFLFIHGGYWQSRDKSDFSFVTPPFVQAGVTVAMAGYTLAPDATVTEIVREVRAAAAWLWREAPGLHIDRERIFAGGWSAGGHLTVMLLTTDWPAFGAGLPRRVVQGGAALSGIYDLEPMRLCYLNDALHLDAAEARRMSPLFNLPKDGPPLIAGVGGIESEEFLRQNAAMAAAWRKQGWPVEEIESPGKDHFTELSQLCEPGNPLLAATLKMIGV